ncbi:MAG: hypothetical protein KF708_22455 [Pirellulales bacterium]|nr:hypothetical protein [Pirellulales bacterium]
MRTVEPNRLNGEWRGIGDVVADVLSLMGFKKKCVPCQRRQSKWNRWLPFGWFRRKTVRQDAPGIAPSVVDGSTVAEA